jgi:hypothetical protein
MTLEPLGSREARQREWIRKGGAMEDVASGKGQWLSEVRLKERGGTGRMDLGGSHCTS